MYEDFFRFNERPFASAPRVEFYFPASSAENAHQTLTRCIGRAEGPGLLIGGAGTGKSLLCNLLAARFRNAFHVVMLSSARLCTRRALLQNILFELNLPYRGLEEGELRLSLIDFLKPDNSDRDGVLLLVDEAHTLPLRLVEEIRMITNSVHDGQPSVRLMLAGGPALEERLASPKLESLNQRIAARCYLQPLNYDETFEYVRSQIFTAGGDPAQVFTEDALAAVHQATDGVPRPINQLCDHALVLAVVNQQQQVDARLIEEAWADLQQLPAPWQGPSTEAFGDEGMIEFGSLEDPDFEEREEECPVVPEPATASDEIDLTRQLREIQTCVAQVERDAEATFESDEEEEANDCVPAEEETFLGVETPFETTDAIQSAVESAEELLAPQTEDPFQESFDEEEIVVDHYARLHAASQSVVSSASGGLEREMEAAAEAIFQGTEHGPSFAEDREDEPTTVEPTEETDTAISEDVTFSEVIVQADREFEDRSGNMEDVEDEDRDPSGIANDVCDMDETVSVQASVMRIPPPDDSDLIVVVDDELGSGQASGDPGAHQDYRRLFSRLRQT